MVHYGWRGRDFSGWLGVLKAQSYIITIRLEVVVHCQHLLSSTDYYVALDGDYYGSLLLAVNYCSISLTIVGYYLAELGLPTDEFHHI